MLALETQAAQTQRRMRRIVMSAMETGNFDAARTALKEYSAIDSAASLAIRHDVVATYGTAL